MENIRQCLYACDKSGKQDYTCCADCTQQEDCKMACYDNPNVCRYCKIIPARVQARIADLHAEVQAKDRRIAELEGELAAKDAIIRQQVIMMAEKEEQVNKIKSLLPDLISFIKRLSLVKRAYYEAWKPATVGASVLVGDKMLRDAFLSRDKRYADLLEQYWLGKGFEQFL